MPIPSIAIVRLFTLGSANTRSRNISNFNHVISFSTSRFQAAVDRVAGSEHCHAQGEVFVNIYAEKQRGKNRQKMWKWLEVLVVVEEVVEGCAARQYHGN